MHTHLEVYDTFSLPPNTIAKVYEKVKFMGWFSATYVYAQQQARLRLKGAMQTFVWIETLVETDNLVVIRPNKIAEDLGVSPATVYAHIQKMREEHVLEPDDKEDPNAKVIRAWRICPFHAWRGQAKYMAKYINNLPPKHPFFEYIDPEFKKSLEHFVEEETKIGE